RRSVTKSFLTFLDVAFHALALSTAKQDALSMQALDAAQLARSSATAQALSRMTARLAQSSTPEKSAFAAQFETLSDQSAALEHNLVAAYGQNPDKVKNAQAELDRVNGELEQASAALKEVFPEYAELATTFLVSVDDLQRGDGRHGSLLG